MSLKKFSELFIDLDSFIVFKIAVQSAWSDIEKPLSYPDLFLSALMDIHPLANPV